MVMLATAALTIALSAASAPPAAPAPVARARVEIGLRLLRAVEIKGGTTTAPHRRRQTVDGDGRKALLIEFE